MRKQGFTKKRFLKIAGNVIFYTLLLLFVTNTEAKSWLLKQLLSTGLFKAEIKKETVIESSNYTSLSYTNEEGSKWSTADLKGKVVFINFWASWCPPCRAEMPSLHELYKKFKADDRIVFLFVNEDEDLAKAKAYLQKEGFSFPFVFATGTVPYQIFSGTLPTTIVLNKQGN
ncbi:MAG: TlpA family protein disulfide reductase, partial [Ilyomonas sp.]